LQLPQEVALPIHLRQGMVVRGDRSVVLYRNEEWRLVGRQAEHAGTRRPLRLIEALDASSMSAQRASASLVDWVDDNAKPAGSRRGNPKWPALEANLTIGQVR
jgi:hypothetical protein